MLNEKGQIQKPHVICFHIYEMSTIDKSIPTESGLMVARGCENEGMGSDC